VEPSARSVRKRAGVAPVRLDVAAVVERTASKVAPGETRIGALTIDEARQS